MSVESIALCSESYRFNVRCEVSEVDARDRFPRKL